ncbi:MAG: trehalose-6-phosphate synthase [Hoeflea sp.]|nr:trehalose-6-phosphate synthase [Hoeflea sp.]
MKQPSDCYSMGAPPTRDDVDAYKEIRSKLEHLSGRINGRFGTVEWTPVQYLHRALPRDELAVLFRLSRVGLVTPLFDGMNLVAKEYVAAQDEADPGVLVLSQCAGAAEEMTEALIVNPHDPQDIADANSMMSPTGARPSSNGLSRSTASAQATWRPFPGRRSVPAHEATSSIHPPPSRNRQSVGDTCGKFTTGLARDGHNRAPKLINR